MEHLLNVLCGSHCLVMYDGDVGTATIKQCQTEVLFYLLF